MNLKDIPGKYLLVEVDGLETKTAAGLTLPASAQPPLRTAVVMQVGKGLDFEVPDNSIALEPAQADQLRKAFAGEKVAIHPHVGIRIDNTADNLTHRRLIRFSDVIAIID